MDAFDFGASSEQGMAEEQAWAESITRLSDDISGEADRLGRAMASAIAESGRSSADVLGAIADGAVHHPERRRSGKASRMNQDDRGLAISRAAAVQALGCPA